MNPNQLGIETRPPPLVLSSPFVVAKMTTEDTAVAKMTDDTPVAKMTDTAYKFRQTPSEFRQRLLAMHQDQEAHDRRENYFYRSRRLWEERLPWEEYRLGSLLDKGRFSNCWLNFLPPSSQASLDAYTKAWLEHKEDLNKEKKKKKKKKKKNKSKGKKPKEEEEEKKKRKAEGKTKLSLETPPLKKHKATAEQDVVVNGFHKEKIINSEAAVQDDDQVVIFKRLKITKSEEAVQDDQVVI